MAERIYNFAAGPCTLPLPTLEKAQSEFVDYHGAGMSLIEMSHRGKHYDEVHHAALANLREVLSIPDSHDILLLQGGATLQFAMVPMNLAADGKTIDLVETGSWAKKALKDADKLGKARVIWSDADNGFKRMPGPDEIEADPGAAYLHITTNETIGGIEMHAVPDSGEVPLVADMSSHIASRPIDWGRIDLAYAGAQKNLGPAGLGVVILRKDLMDRAPDSVPAYLSYKTHAGKESLYNTPPVFAIYMMKLTMDWVKAVGGLAEMDKRAAERSRLLYEAIDESGGWYRCPVDKESRSRMNVVWRLADEDLEKKMIAEAQQAGFSGLKGHRSVGGLRASMYNAMPVEGARDLAGFMREFAKKNG